MVGARSDLFVALLAFLICEPLDCRAKELQPVRLGLVFEISVLHRVEVSARAWSYIIIVTLKHIVIDPLFVRVLSCLCNGLVLAWLLLLRLLADDFHALF